jgi:hypothetical protein
MTLKSSKQIALKLGSYLIMWKVLCMILQKHRSCNFKSLQQLKLEIQLGMDMPNELLNVLTQRDK